MIPYNLHVTDSAENKYPGNLEDTDGRRWLALDIGDVRTGVAVSDESGALASPMTTIKAKTKELLLDAFAEAIRKFEYESGDYFKKANGEADQELWRRVGDMDSKPVKEMYAGLVIGLPLDQSGVEALRAKKVREWGEFVAEGIGLEAFFFDERYTTQRMLSADREVGRRVADGRKNIDARAAAEILQSFLDARARARDDLSGENDDGGSGENTRGEQ